MYTCIYVCVCVCVCRTSTKGRAYTLLVTFSFALFFDQLRNIIIQMFIWFVIQRRGGQMPIMDEKSEFTFEDDSAKSRKSVFKIGRSLLQRLIAHPYFDIVIYSLVGFYAVLVMATLSLGDETIQSVDGLEEVLFNLDLALLCCFLVEVLLRVMAFGWSYVLDPWNAFDAIVVLVSFVFAVFVTNLSNTDGLFVLRLLRLLRLVLVLRKATKSNKVKRPPGSGILLTSPVERVLAMLRAIRDLEVCVCVCVRVCLKK